MLYKILKNFTAVLLQAFFDFDAFLIFD